MVGSPCVVVVVEVAVGVAVFLQVAGTAVPVTLTVCAHEAFLAQLATPLTSKLRLVPAYFSFECLCLDFSLLRRPPSSSSSLLRTGRTEPRPTLYHAFDFLVGVTGILKYKAPFIIKVLYNWFYVTIKLVYRGASRLA
jgi:hypothetical protein